MHNVSFLSTSADEISGLTLWELVLIASVRRTHKYRVNLLTFLFRYSSKTQQSVQQIWSLPTSCITILATAIASLILVYK